MRESHDSCYLTLSLSLSLSLQRMAQCPYAELGPPLANRPEIKRIDANTVSIVPQTTNPVTDSAGCGE